MKNSKIIICVILLLFGSGCATVPKPALHPPILSGVKPVVLVHVVERGETLFRIAQRYHVEVSDLMRANSLLSPSRIEYGQRLIVPVSMAAGSFPTALSRSEIRSLVGLKNYGYRWKTITLHHSATHRGSARLFDRDHRRRKMGGLFYHFVIGNGTSTSDGAIEVGWRWRKQVPANRPFDIQICLVGNFDEQDVSKAQEDSLVSLIQILKQQYEISVQSIRKHNDIPGKHTDCPGSRFPFYSVIKRVNSPALSTDR